MPAGDGAAAWSAAMDDRQMEWFRGAWVVSTRRDRLDLDAVLALLRETHWGHSLTPERLRRAVAHSVCFGVYEGPATIGFARVVTDLATYGYLTDVVVTASRRGRGIGGWLTECILVHPELQGFRHLTLLTRDAEPLYAKAGFVRGAGPLVYMERTAHPAGS
jgi:N-acetylglutamate synthase-like GNAT family acetyltransferase